MIICSEETLAIGEYRRGRVSDMHADYHDGIAFVVVREATEEEYRRHAEECGAAYNPPFYVPMRFYEVAMD